MQLKTGEVIKVRGHYYKVAVGKNKPSCGKCWFFAGMRWCCLDGTSKNHYINMDHCKTLININGGQYFTMVTSSTEGGV